MCSIYMYMYMYLNVYWEEQLLNTIYLFPMGQPLLNELHCLSRHFLLDSVQAGVGVASMEGHHHKTLKTC